MLRTVEVDSADDTRLTDYTRLTDVGPADAPGGRARPVHRGGHEGHHPCRRRGVPGALHAARPRPAGRPARARRGGRARQRRAASAAREAPRREASRAPRRCTWYPDEVAERLTGYRVHRGALASLARKPLPEVRDGDRRRTADRRARGPGGPRQRRRDLPVRRRARRGRGACCRPVRRPAVPAVGQGVDGRGVRDTVRPDDRLVRRPRGAEVRPGSGSSR